MGHLVSVVTAQFNVYSAKEAIDNSWMNEYSCVPKKLYKNRQLANLTCRSSFVRPCSTILFTTYMLEFTFFKRVYLSSMEILVRMSWFFPWWKLNGTGNQKLPLKAPYDAESS